MDLLTILLRPRVGLHATDRTKLLLNCQHCRLCRLLVVSYTFAMLRHHIVTIPSASGSLQSDAGDRAARRETHRLLAGVAALRVIRVAVALVNLALLH